MVNFKCSTCNKKTAHEQLSEGWAGSQWTEDFICKVCGEMHCRDAEAPKQQTEYFVTSTYSNAISFKY